MRTIITGASGGIGQAVARHLARESDAALLLVVRNGDQGNAQAAELRALGAEATANRRRHSRP